MKQIELKDFVEIKKTNNNIIHITQLKATYEEAITNSYPTISFVPTISSVKLDDKMKHSDEILSDAIDLLLTNQKKYDLYKDNKDIYYYKIPKDPYEVNIHMSKVSHMISHQVRNSGQYIVIVPMWLSYLDPKINNIDFYCSPKLNDDIIILKKGELTHESLVYIENDNGYYKLFMTDEYDKWYQVIKTKSYQEIRKEKLKRLL
jgi:hypothetical protein